MYDGKANKINNNAEYTFKNSKNFICYLPI